MSNPDDVQTLAETLWATGGETDAPFSSLTEFYQNRYREQATAILVSPWFGQIREQIIREWTDEIGNITGQAPKHVRDVPLLEVVTQKVCEGCEQPITKDHDFFHRDWIHVHSDSRWCDFIEGERYNGMARPKESTDG